MNPYDRFQRSLQGSERVLSKDVLIRLSTFKHPNLCDIHQVIDSSTGLEVQCELLSFAIQDFLSAMEMLWGQEELVGRFLGVIAGLRTAQEQVKLNVGITTRTDFSRSALPRYGYEGHQISGFRRLQWRASRALQ